MPAYLNLADVYRAQGREVDVVQTLRRGLTIAPNDPALHSALGLAYARVDRLGESVEELRRAAALGRRAEYDYAYAVALHSAGRAGEAIAVVDAALVRAPNDRDLLFALATFHRDAGHHVEARRAAERLVGAHPTDAEARGLLESLVAAP